MPYRKFIALAGVFGFLGVASGAFGAHALKNILAPDLLTIFETGSRYCLHHSIALLATALYGSTKPSPWLIRACWGFSIGITIFAGSLWVLALTNTRWLGAITPIGGLSMLLGWSCIVVYALKIPQDIP